MFLYKGCRVHLITKKNNVSGSAYRKRTCIQIRIKNENKKILQKDRKRMTKMPSGAKFSKGTSFQGGSLFF
jgi:hypothetical protein